MSAPESLDITAAAQQVIVCQEVGGQSALTARYIWEDLTGLTGDEALAYARELVLADHPTTAHIPPM